MANAENNLVEIDLKKEYIAFNRKSNYLLWNQLQSTPKFTYPSRSAEPYVKSGVNIKEFLLAGIKFTVCTIGSMQILELSV
jgi:hypothetical protein